MLKNRQPDRLFFVFPGRSGKKYPFFDDFYSGGFLYTLGEFILS
jgi:hypothetical protein